MRTRQLAHWKFRRQHPINGFITDFVTIDGKLVIEIDGVTHATAAELAYDARRTRVLEVIVSTLPATE